MNPQVLTYLPLIGPVATLVVVVLGVFFSNHHFDVRISDLRSYMDSRFNAIDARFNSMDQLFQERFSRIEQDLHLK